MKTTITKVLRVFHEAIQSNRGGEVVLRCRDKTARVFVVAGKIAWATASTLQTTFTDYLKKHSQLDQDAVSEAFEECKRTGKKLGETLVEWGLMEEGALRALMLQHFGQILTEVFTWEPVESMFMPEERDYRASLTFELKDLLAEALQADTAGRLPFAGRSAADILQEIETRGYEPTQPGLAAMGPSEDPTVKGASLGSPEQAPVVKSRVWVFLVIGLSLIVLVLGGIAVYLLVSQRPAPAVPAPAAPEIPPAVAEAPADGGPVAAAVPGDPGLVPIAGEGPAKVAEDPAPAVKEDQAPTAIVAGVPGDGIATLTINSVPKKAKIYLDGLFTGKLTPATLVNVPAGREHVILVEGKGVLPDYRKITLQKDAKAKLDLILGKRGKPPRTLVPVQITSEPAGALILVNGKNTKQRTPATIQLRADRSWKLELRLAGTRKWARVLRLIPDVEIGVQATLK